MLKLRVSMVEEVKWSWRNNSQVAIFTTRRNNSQLAIFTSRRNNSHFENKQRVTTYTARLTGQYPCHWEFEPSWSCAKACATVNVVVKLPSPVQTWNARVTRTPTIQSKTSKNFTIRCRNFGHASWLTFDLADLTTKVHRVKYGRTTNGPQV